MKAHSGTFFAFSICGLLISASTARACSCAFLPVEEKFDGATAVFLGEVIGKSLPFPGEGLLYQVVRFRVIEAWKGLSGSTVDVQTSYGCCACGFSPSQG